MAKSELTYFHPLIQKWFTEMVGVPTDAQEKSWKEIREGNHVLLTAPTGSGKTLAAFLWSINQLVTGEWPSGTVRILYISPMKALNNDIHKNLEKPLREIGEYFEKAGEDFPAIRAQTRSGDTTGAERHRMYRKPPEIFITTPESLNILVTSKSGRTILSGVAAVILDEIHAVLSVKRGTLLITAVDRLVRLCGEFQRIALSATVKPLSKVAEFVGGYRLLPGGVYEKRELSIVLSAMEKKLKMKVLFPQEAQNDGAGETQWTAIIKHFKQIIEENNSTLFFANSKRLTEKITHFINEEEEQELAYSHHGALSKEIRLAVEGKLKQGELKAIVATNSLELGIDIGDLDKVVLVQPPRSVSGTIQRIGRSGHGVNETSEGLVFPLHGKDFLTAAVISRAVLDKDIEEVHPVENPLDVLAQLIIAMVIPNKWEMDDLYDTIKTSYPFHRLTRRHFDLVAEMLAGGYADSKIRELSSRVRIDKLENTIAAKDGIAFLLYTSGGTIPDRGSFVLRHGETKAKIGELDEEFVWERSLGETFTLGTQAWRIQRITHNDVEVIPVSTTHNIIPFWRAEELNRDFHLSEKIAVFLEDFNGRINDENITEVFKSAYTMDQTSAECLRSYLNLQKEFTGTDLPHRHNILVEHYDDPLNTSGNKQVIIHTLWGGRVNRPFSLALSAAWRQKQGYPLQTFADNDCVLLILPHEFTDEDLLSMVNSDNVEKLLRQRLEESGYFGAHFRENAGRALLLPKRSIKKRIPLWLTRKKTKKLLGAVMKYADFPILLETWRECLQDDFDLPNLKMLLDEIESAAIKISRATTKTASPFAGNVIWRQTNKFMYEDDTPEGRNRSSLSDSLINELLFTSHLRPKIDMKLVSILRGKLQRTQEGYTPLSPEDLVDWIAERLLIPEDEWTVLVQAAVRDSGLEEELIIREVGKKTVFIFLPASPVRFTSAIERLPFIQASLGLAREELVMEFMGNPKETARLIDLSYSLYREKEGSDAAELSLFLSAWLSYYGPLPVRWVKELFGLTPELFDEALGELKESKQAVLDTFTPESRELEICDIGNLEILLRMARHSRRPVFEPLECRMLPLFLASFQGVTGGGCEIERLKDSLNQLFGCPAEAAAWEEYIFPARVRPFYKSHLDSLLQTTELVWYGCGPGKTAFAFADDLELFLEKEEETKTIVDRLKALFPDMKGKYSFFDIKDFSGGDSTSLTETLWGLIWKGYITNDSYSLLRKGIENNFRPQKIERRNLRPRRSGFSRWESSRPTSGAFYLLPGGKEEGADTIYRQELIKDRVRQLFARYGLVFREILTKEAPLLQWKNVYKTLRLMELSGEILSGYFFEGLGGPQFISLEAYRILQRELDRDSIYWINACDPASLCGAGIAGLKQSLLPQRMSSNFIVYHGPAVAAVLKRGGKELEMRVPPAHPRIVEYLECCKILLTREFRPVKRIRVEKINGQNANTSEYAEDLKKMGFSPSPKGLELWRNF